MEREVNTMKIFDRSEEMLFAAIVVGFSVFLVAISFYWGEYQAETMALIGTWFSIMLGFFFGKKRNNQQSKET